MSGERPLQFGLLAITFKLKSILSARKERECRMFCYQYIFCVFLCLAGFPFSLGVRLPYGHFEMFEIIIWKAQGVPQ